MGNVGTARGEEHCRISLDIQKEIRCRWESKLLQSMTRGKRLLANPRSGLQQYLLTHHASQLALPPNRSNGDKRLRIRPNGYQRCIPEPIPERGHLYAAAQRMKTALIESATSDAHYMASDSPHVNGMMISVHRLNPRLQVDPK